jgi:hypothetical protein
MKKCKICRAPFTPRFSTLQATCEKPECILANKKKADEKAAKREIKAMRERLKSVSSYRNDLQKIFNEFIRLRDKDKPCISCGSPLTGKYDAGHGFSVGSYPNLRFNEDNVHGQCVHCNRHKHGAANEYMIGLEARIGKERFEHLKSIRNEPLKLPLDEIKELIEVYRGKVAALKGK